MYAATAATAATAGASQPSLYEYMALQVKMDHHTTFASNEAASKDDPLRRPQQY